MTAIEILCDGDYYAREWSRKHVTLEDMELLAELEGAIHDAAATV